MRPRIAITADTLTEATNIINERNAPFAPRPLIEALVKSDAVPVILPSVQPEFCKDYIDLFDGIIFSGGADVDPTFYGEEPHMDLGMTLWKRDVFEVELLKQAYKAGKPILGICRGMQLINTALGGTCYQDLSEDPRAKLKHSQEAPGNLPTHHVTTAEDSRLRALVGERPYVNSRHHQTLNKIATPLKVVARADDGVPEAVESTASDQVLAVQWHPENMFKHFDYSKKLFADLVNRAAKASEKKEVTDQQAG